MLYPRIKKIVQEKAAEWGNTNLVGFSTPVAKKLIKFMEVNYPAIHARAIEICDGYTLVQSSNHGFYLPQFKSYFCVQDSYPRKPTEAQVVADILWHLVCNENEQFIKREFMDFSHAYNKENFAFYHASEAVRNADYINHDYTATVVINTTPKLIDGYIDANLTYLRNTTAATFKSVTVNAMEAVKYDFDSSHQLTADELEIGLTALADKKVRYVIEVVITGKIKKAISEAA